MKQTDMKRFYYLAATLFMVVMLAGCGGGSGNPVGVTPKASPGNGLVQARVSFEGTQAYRTYLSRKAAQTAGSGVVEVKIVITGRYKDDDSEFSVESIARIDLAVGYARISIVEVPIGDNHLLAATADFGGGLKETVKTIIYTVDEGEITQAMADRQSTVIADAAILYASRNGVPLSKVGHEVFETLAAMVSDLGPDALDVDISQLLEALKVSSITIDPTTVTISSTTQEFSATALGSDGNEVTGALISWTVEPATLGYFESPGIFKPLATGQGVVSASAGQVSASADVTVECLPLCGADSDCAGNASSGSSIYACIDAGTCDAFCISDSDACFSGVCSTCNVDGVCDFSAPDYEHPGSCHADCSGLCNNNGTCDPDEDPVACPSDCSPTGLPCGNSYCEFMEPHVETAASCALDCDGTCDNNTICTPNEEPSTCGDCRFCFDRADASTCGEDMSCEWTGTECIQADHLDFCSLFDTETACLGEMGCEWDATAGCMMSGFYGSCDMDGVCDFSAPDYEHPEACPEDCSGLCNGNNICDPDEDSVACPSDCSPTGLACGNGVCQFFEPENEDPTTCALDCDGSCNNNTFCEHSEEPSTCIDCTPCEARTTMAFCAEGMDCEWDGTTCAKAVYCGNYYCDINESPTTCASDCMDCGAVLEQTVCESDPLCQWALYPETYTCVILTGGCNGDSVCDRNEDTSCSDCPSCGDLANGEPGVSGFVCTNDPACSWMDPYCIPQPVQPICENSVCESGENMDWCPLDCTACADMLDPVDCGNDTSCHWDGTTCISGGECNSDNVCQTGENISNCHTDCMICIDIPDPVACENNPGCSFDGTSCIDTPSPCNSDSVCDSIENTTCADCAFCSDIMDPGTCENDRSCTFNGFDCLDAGCGNGFCEYGENTGSCSSDCISCSDVVDGMACMDDLACAWDGFSCVIDTGSCNADTVCDPGEDTSCSDCASCAAITDDPSCFGDTTCFWGGSSCYDNAVCVDNSVCEAGEDTSCADCGKCSDIPSDIYCHYDMGCFWNGTGCMDMVTCIDNSSCDIGEDTSCADCSLCSQIPDGSYCDFDPMCVWNSSTCIDNPCLVNTDQATCESNSCAWNFSKCAPDYSVCPGIVDETSCNADINCSWNPGMLQCEADETPGAGCDLHSGTTQTTCESYTCVWKSQMCI